MKFQLQEDFSKSIPNWLKKELLKAAPYSDQLKTNLNNIYFDFKNANFTEIPLPEDEIQKENVIWNWIDQINEGTINNQQKFILFLLVKTLVDGKDTEMVFCPFVNEKSYSDEGNLRFLVTMKPKKVIAACYATNWAKDFLKLSKRAAGRTQHNSLALDGNERVAYEGNPYSENRIILDGRQFDASGYLSKPLDHYTKKLLKYQRSDIARTLEELHNKIQDCANVIKDFITNEVDLVDLESYDQAQSLLKKLNVASKRYKRAMAMLDLCESEEKIDELFEPKSEFDSLNKLIKDLTSATKEVRYTDFDW